MHFTLNCVDLFAGLEAALVKHLGPVCNSELSKLVQMLIGGDEEAYNQMHAEYLANLTQSQNGNDNFKLDKINIRKELKTKALIQLTILSAMINRRRRYSARIDQGDFKSTTFIASMPIPPTLMKGGLHHATEAGV